MIFQSGLGIDFRQKSVAIALLKASLAGVKAGAHETLVFPEGIDRAEKIKQAARLIRSFIEANRIDTLDIYLSIPRERMIVREIDFPAAVADSLSTTLAYELERYVPMPAAEVYLDHLVLSGKTPEDKIKVLIAAARKEDVDAYLALSEQIGTRLSGVEFRSSALVDFFGRDASAVGEGLYAFLYADGDGIELAFSRRENGKDMLLYSRFFSGQGEYVEAGLWEAFQDVRKILETEPGPLRVLYVEKNLSPSLLNRLGQTPGVALHPVWPLETGHDAANAFSAQALAMRGIRQSGNAMNLLPATARKRSGRIPQYIFFALSGLVLLGLISWGGSTLLRRQLDHRALDARIAAFRKDVERVQKVETELMEIQKTVDEVNTLSERRQLFTNLLKELTRIVPHEAWVSALNYDAPEFQIEGVAEKATKLVPLIEASPIFSDTRVLSAITREPDGKERFRFGFEVQHD